LTVAPLFKNSTNKIPSLSLKPLAITSLAQDLPHPTYSPHLAPTDFHRFLAPWWTHSEDAVLLTTMSWNTAHVKSCDALRMFYAAGIQRHMQRWKKCIDNAGDFVEKLYQLCKWCNQDIYIYIYFITIVIIVSEKEECEAFTIYRAYTNNCIIIRYNDIQRVVNLLHVSAFSGHIQGGIQQIKIN
jgi:hypothetical protein